MTGNTAMETGFQVESLERAGVGFSPESGRTDRVGEIYVMITWRCNLRCRMCPMWGDRGFCRSLGAGEETLDVGTLASFIGDALDLDPRSVTISGGEPLLSPLCIPLAGTLAGKGLRVTLTTNATMLGELKAEDISIFEKINVSLDGPPLVLQRLNRGGEGTFKKALDGMRKVMSSRKGGRPRLQLLTVITPEGVGHLNEMLDFFCSEGIEFDSLFFQHQMFLSAKTASRQVAALEKQLGRGKESAIWQAFVSRTGQVDVEVLTREIRMIEEKYPGSVFSPALEKKQLRSYYGSGTWTPEPFRKICLSPWFDFGITPSGDVWICPGFSAGNIHRSSFEKIWNGAKARRIRRTLAAEGVFPGCRSCFYLYNYK